MRQHHALRPAGAAAGEEDDVRVELRQLGRADVPVGLGGRRRQQVGDGHALHVQSRSHLDAGLGVSLVDKGE